jgi:predicted NBD/HSP70 family sugar kinase
LSNTQGLLSQVIDSLSNFTARVRALVTLALVTIVVSLIWVLATTEGHASWLIILVPAAALLGLGIVLLITAAFLQVRLRAEGDDVASGGEFVLGCLLGRQTVTAGMLRVRGSPGRVVPPGTQVSVFVKGITVRLPEGSRNSRQLCDELTALIIRVLEQSHDKSGFTYCSAIGVATPGVIDIRTGQLNISVTLPEGTDVPRELARRILEKGSHTAGEALKHIGGSEQSLAQHILIDNDVRCIARHILSEHQWDQFTCLYAGSGVGGAFVVDRQVYFGAHGSASHVGHLELEAHTGRLMLATGQSLGPVECDCGIFGFHLDAFANYNGFRRIAECIAADEAHRLLDLIKEAQGKSGLSENEFYREAFLEIVVAAGSRVPANLSPSVHEVLADAKQIEHLARDVLRSYVGILVAGFSTLTHVLDPGIIVICGSLIERLQENDLFAKYLRENLPAHLVDSRAHPQLAPAVARNADWQGAALLSWDSGYQRRHMVKP